MSDQLKILRVLVVDDVESVLKITIHMVRNLGIDDVTGVPDGDTALKHCRDARPDVVLCDLNMKPMNGFEFTKNLRALGRDHERIPVIFMTTFADQTIVEKARNINAAGYLLKPLSPKKLEQTFEKIIEHLWSS